MDQPLDLGPGLGNIVWMSSNCLYSKSLYPTDAVQEKMKGYYRVAPNKNEDTLDSLKEISSWSWIQTYPFSRLITHKGLRIQSVSVR